MSTRILYQDCGLKLTRVVKQAAQVECEVREAGRISQRGDALLVV